MKYLFLIATLISCHAIVAQAESKSADPGTSFGRRLIDCSSGRGLCSFAVPSNAASKSADTRIATKTAAATFKLTIFRSVLTEEDELRIAGKRFSEIVDNEILAFMQQDVMIVDTATLNNLLIDPAMNKVQPGAYPLQVHKDRVEIAFTLSN